MNAERWPKVKAMFHAALERPPTQRASFVEEASAGDLELRSEVERLLKAHTEAGSFIETSVPAAQGIRASIPHHIGRYTIMRRLGAGGMGEVYVARDSELGRDVALKIGRDADPDAQARLRREAQYASRLNHPHICTIHEVGIADGRAYIAMEYVEGQPLADIIPEDGLALDEMLRYSTQIADGLAHAHQRGITHRDLKSENVMITRDERAKILDFGLAARVPAQRLKELSQSRESVTDAGLFAGTLSAMAPETLRGEAPDERSDIWALGVLLHEMASGARPFTGATGFELSGAILHQPPPPLPARVPPALQNIIERCLAKDPGERYQRAEEVRAALDAIQAHAGRPADSRAALRQAAMAAVAVLAGVWLVFAFVSGRFRTAEPAALGPSGRPALAVMHFEIVGGDATADSAWLSSGVPSMLVTGLAQTRGLEVVSTQRLYSALKQVGAPSFEKLDRQDAAEVARRAGAGAVVVGSIFRAGSEIRIDAQVEDLASGRMLGAQSVRGTDVFALVDQLAGEIRDVVGFSEAPGIRQVAEVSTTSLEAYRLYSEGLASYFNVRWHEARPLLTAATAQDPGFAQAHLMLAYVEEFAGRPAARREHLRQAIKYGDRLPLRDRLLAQVLLARDNGQSHEAARTLDELIAQFPDVENGYISALLLYEPVTGTMPDPEKYMAILARGVKTLPTATAVRNTYGYSLLSLGRTAEAIREFETYAGIAPREANPYDSLGEAHLMLGYPEKAIEYYLRALTIDPAFYTRNLEHPGGQTTPLGLVWANAMLGRYDQALAGKADTPWAQAFVLSRVGRHREAEKLLIDERARIGNLNDLANGYLYLQSSAMATERREHSRAISYVQEASRSFERLPGEQGRVPMMVANLLAGLAKLGESRFDEARARAAAVKQSCKPSIVAEKWWCGLLDAELSLAHGDLDTAARQFAEAGPAQKMWFMFNPMPTVVFANGLLARDGIARVQARRGEFDAAIRTYRQLLAAGPDQKWTAPLEPRYVLEIARILERKGDRKAALAEYARFLEFWKGADADLPEVDEARKAVIRLRTTTRS